ncbi:MAG: hypothetical protein QOJ64_537 [Acidobacteriota bacterium]|jgi:hypothetical protein|nr:hypothetical protein [Acidobacteriota bacterium]
MNARKVFNLDEALRLVNLNKTLIALTFQS